MDIRLAQKNEFFSYFSVGGHPARYRADRQVWNSEGLTINVQGTIPGGNVANGPGLHNSFGKRHLLATEGGKDAGNFAAKAAKLRSKRVNSAGNEPRVDKSGAIVNANVQRPDYAKSAVGQQQFLAARAAAWGTLNENYRSDVYTTTNINSFFLLDGLTIDYVAFAFATQLNALAPWVPSVKRLHVHLELGAGTCFESTAAAAATARTGLDVDVWYDGATHFIYHCNHAY